jgi:hypothetical protein
MFGLQNVSRRDLLKMASLGILGGSVSGWFNVLTARAQVAASQGVKHKSMILLWMAGGAAQTHTWDVKPGAPFKSATTSVPGIEGISEYLPKMAAQMHNIVVLRSMRTGDANHGTGTYLMHTGYRQGSGGVTYPSIGSIVAKELGDPQFELPNYISLGGGGRGGTGAGYLGPRYAPFRTAAGRGIPDLTPTDVSMSEFDQRFSLVDELDRAFNTDYIAPSIQAHHVGVQQAVKLMKSTKTKAFDLGQEPSEMQNLYGNSPFGKSCLLARRLIEVGVPFVEVSHGGWDTHNQTDERLQKLNQAIDQPMAALISDLKQRGLLDNTLVVWASEFGRTPMTGQNHFARAWSTVMAGAGIKGGRIIGKTDAKGANVEERPISSPDFLATICMALGIDYTKEYTTRSGRPKTLTAKGANPVKELFA